MLELHFRQTGNIDSTQWNECDATCYRKYTRRFNHEAKRSTAKPKRFLKRITHLHRNKEYHLLHGLQLLHRRLSARYSDPEIVRNVQ